MFSQSADATTWLFALCLVYMCRLCRYHMTSIYDISVYEGLSRVIQRLIPQQPALERLLNGFALVSLLALSLNIVIEIKWLSECLVRFSWIQLVRVIGQWDLADDSRAGGKVITEMSLIGWLPGAQNMVCRIVEKVQGAPECRGAWVPDNF